METDYQHILNCISPSLTDRNTWVRVGMALKEEGCPFEMFDQWSAGDSRPGQYQGTEVTRRVWDSFQGLGSGTVTGATLVQIAREQGTDPFPKGQNSFYDWNDDITSDGDEPCYQVQKKPAAIKLSARQKPLFQIIDYLESCFKPDDHINIIKRALKTEDGKLKPFGSGMMSITVQEYCDQIREAADSPEWFEEVFGSYDHQAGVWIRINPVTGKLDEGQKAVSDRNVTSFENALIECDELTLDEQIQMIKDLHLPYRALVYSGSRSVHAIVKVDGKSLADYRDKVTWLQDYCIAKGLPVDTQNKNPSRMSRLPGCQRGENQQILLETAKPIPFEEFRKMAEAEQEADMLEISSFGSVYENLPPKAPELITGMLRKGHKMIVSGAPKAGKSFALIGLAIAIAEGKDWMGYQCSSGRVLYINLEVDEPSFWHRINDVYKAKGWSIDHPENIDVMNLRGRAEPLSTLAPKLEVRLRRTKYDLVIVDPIYKVITGDENNASDMGKFCNLFDRIAKSGDCAVAYCHHHSKGSQAQKSAIDRASGSGVFARDPDAIVDLTELYVSEADREELKARLMESVVDSVMKSTGQWTNLEKVHPEQLMDRIAKQELVSDYFNSYPEGREQFQAELDRSEALGSCSALRMSVTLREFASPPDREILFSYPIHIADPTGYLKSMYLQGDNSIQTLNKKKAEKTQKRADKKREWYDKQREANIDVSVSEMAEYFGCVENTIRKWADKQEGIKRENGWIVFIDETAPEQKQRGKGVKN